MGKKGASVIMLGIALIGQHHVGRGIKGRLVQYGIGDHKVGVDIHKFILSCQFQAALTSSPLLHLGIAQASLALLSTCATPAAMVVDIVAEVFFINGSVHTVRSTRSRATAVFSPEKEASLLKHFAWPTHAHLSKVSCLIPAHIIKQAVLIVKHAFHGVRLVVIAIAVTGFLVAFLTECDDIHRCTVHFRGHFTCEIEGVNPLDFRAVYTFDFIYGPQQLFTICLAYGLLIAI